jgi:putative PIN family toxin of toxin-antitoxin system
MLVVVDTNVWVSALLNPRGFPARLLRAFLEGQFTPVVSRELLQELADVLSRPRLWRSFTRRLSRLDTRLALSVLRIYQWVAALLLHTLSQAGHWVVLQGNTEGCRDLRDNMFLEAAVRGNAHYLVSRDGDLKRDLELVAQMASRGIEVVSVQQFLDILSGSADG